MLSACLCARDGVYASTNLINPMYSDTRSEAAWVGPSAHSGYRDGSYGVITCTWSLGRTLSTSVLRSITLELQRSGSMATTPSTIVVVLHDCTSFTAPALGGVRSTRTCWLERMTDAPADTAEVKPCACTLNWSPVTMPSPDALSVMLNMLWFAAAHCNPSQSMHSWRRPPSERRPASQRVHPNGSHDSCADISAWPGQQNDVTRMTRTPSTRSRAVISDELAKTIGDGVST
mmetsp:Transcript_27543/g.68082  ORF Transcript_27543/g.68082 Transcript_27543/m.68082 type:complete len:232 (-) Transcript_27543:1197-1892(-)